MNRYAAILAAAFLPGCSTGLAGSGHPATDNRQVPPFTQVSAQGSYQVDITSGSPQSVAITADDNLLPVITTTVTDGTLHIDTRGAISSRSTVVKITVPSLAGVSIDGTVQGTLHGIKAPSFTVNLSGAGDLTLDGEADTFTSQLSGVGTLHAEKLHCKTVKTELSGTGTAQVYATDTLDASISGTGTIFYGGNPETVHQSVSGVGSLKKL